MQDYLALQNEFLRGSRAGKMEMHSEGKPYVNQEKCIGCKMCTKICAHEGVTVTEKKAFIDHASRSKDSRWEWRSWVNTTLISLSSSARALISKERAQIQAKDSNNVFHILIHFLIAIILYFNQFILYQTVFEKQAAELRMLGALGVDVSTFGNHEFDYRLSLDAPYENDHGVPYLLVAYSRRAHCPVFISLNHFKGHEMTGFGGALKNIGMGCGSFCVIRA